MIKYLVAVSLNYEWCNIRYTFGANLVDAENIELPWLNNMVEFWNYFKKKKDLAQKMLLIS